ncbi:MAG: 2-hydroxychromene-2-carboxylate isomerase [Betaproteobacteria bacterium]|jgi:2-hydroxychromene-2-carboxylate isomerase|nr:2-hydroxychromene-2-carboxylate isomerase [Betaproteobacteria bacterium]
MKSLNFWFDPISPYAHLAFEHLPQALEGCSVVVDYKPVLFGALLKHHHHKGPAEIEPKRAWTFRQVSWQARQLNIRLDLPAQHPFNPLVLLRLLLAAAGPMGLPNRHQVEQVFRHVWQGGGDPLDPARLANLRAAMGLGPQAAEADDVKARLKVLTDEALAKGLFGVPTFECEGRLFWGLDALPMLRAALQGDTWFDETWEDAARRLPGIERR